MMSLKRSANQSSIVASRDTTAQYLHMDKLALERHLLFKAWGNQTKMEKIREEYCLASLSTYFKKSPKFKRSTVSWKIGRNREQLWALLVLKAHPRWTTNNLGKISKTSNLKWCAHTVKYTTSRFLIF
jgi:hypothetical protein